MKSGRYCASHVDPWPSQKAVIGWIDVHYYKLKVKGVRLYLDWKFDISKNFSFSPIKSSDHHLTFFHVGKVNW